MKEILTLDVRRQKCGGAGEHPVRGLGTERSRASGNRALVAHTVPTSIRFEPPDLRRGPHRCHERATAGTNRASSQESRHPANDGRQGLQLALPNHESAPTERSQFSQGGTVSAFVALYLGNPIIAILYGHT